MLFVWLTRPSCWMQVVRWWAEAQIQLRNTSTGPVRCQCIEQRLQLHDGCIMPDGISCSSGQLCNSSTSSTEWLPTQRWWSAFINCTVSASWVLPFPFQSGIRQFYSQEYRNAKGRQGHGCNGNAFLITASFYPAKTQLDSLRECCKFPRWGMWTPAEIIFHTLYK